MEETNETQEQQNYAAWKIHILNANWGADVMLCNGLQDPDCPKDVLDRAEKLLDDTNRIIELEGW